MSGYTFVSTDWAAHAPAISSIRRQVFVVQQHVAEYEEWDAADLNAVHVLALDEKRDAVGTGRLDGSGKVGRVAVLSAHRGCGVGAGIMLTLLDAARANGTLRPYLNAQVQAERFYRALGFAPVGATFMEAGISHVRMELKLD